MKKRIVSIILSLVMLLSLLPMSALPVAATTPSKYYDGGGDGSADNPWLISNLDQLTDLATAVNGGTNMSSKYFKLTADIGDNTTDFSTPIGTSGKAFSGTFDGDGHTVTLDISNMEYAGLFGYVSGTVNNVITAGSVSGTSNVGGVCGYIAENGTILNCGNTATVTGNSGNTGGVCGYIDAKGTVANSYNTGTVKNGTNVGGVCGSIAKNGKLTNCYSVKLTLTASNCGDVCGKNAGTITNCYGNSNDLIGGVIGEQTGSYQKAPSVVSIFCNNLNNYITSPANAETTTGFYRWTTTTGVNSDKPYIMSPWAQLGDALKGYILTSVDGLFTLNITGNTTTITLQKDITAVTNDTALTVEYNNYNKILDLNGHVINGAGLVDKVIKVSGGATLTIKDGSEDKYTYFDYVKGGAWTLNTTADSTAKGNATDVSDITDQTTDGTLIEVLGGAITGGNTNGGVSVAGTLEMEKGNIVGNSATQYGGGVFISSGGSFELSGGAICGNAATDGGGGVTNQNGTFIMDGGTISYNNASAGGGVYNHYNDLVKTAPAFTMKKGVIANNSANQGGGVKVRGGTFTMEGGNIESNSAKVNGGGVSVEGVDGGSSTYFYLNGGTIAKNSCSGSTGGAGVHLSTFTAYLYMGGGSIENNTASGSSGAGGIATQTSVFIGGTARVTGNTKNDAASNLSVPSSGLKIGTGATDQGGNGVPVPTEDMMVGVTGQGTNGWIAECAVSLGYDKYFSSDVSQFYVAAKKVNDTECLALVKCPTVTVSNLFNGTVTADPTSAKAGVTVTLTVTPDEGYQLLKEDGLKAYYWIESKPEYLTLTQDQDDETKYTFEMPAYDVTVAAWFEEEIHEHEVNGVTTTFTAWKSNNSLPTAANLQGGVGSFYLTDDVTLSSMWTVPNGTSSAAPNTINLCLNGHVIKLGEGITGSVIKVPAYTTLNLYDCGKTKHHFSVDSATGLWTLLDEKVDGCKTVTGGVITGGAASDSSYGGGVYVTGNSAAFTMKAGNICGNKAGKGGGVYVEKAASFTMENGTISGNTTTNGNGGGVHVTGTNTTFTMKAGTISENVTGSTYQNDGGGGVYVGSSASFVMEDGTISKNRVSYFAGYGGGVHVESSFTMKKGVISDNTAGSGGGVYVKGSAASFTMENGAITQNEVTNSNSYGGGVYVYKGASFEMKDGEINKNEAIKHGGGVSVRSGRFTMTGGTISENKAPNGAGIYVFAGDDTANSLVTMKGGAVSRNEASSSTGGVYLAGSKIIFMMENSEITDNSGSGVYCGGNGNPLIILGGTARITGNTVTQGTVQNCVRYNGIIELGTGSEGNGVAVPADGMLIGISRHNYSEVPDQITVANEAYSNYVKYFTSDSDLYYVDYDTENQYLGFMAFGSKKAVTVNQAEHGVVYVSPQAAASGGITVEIIPDNGYELATLNVGGNDVLPLPAQNDDDSYTYTFTITENTTVAATFKKASPAIRVTKAKNEQGQELENPVYGTAVTDYQLFTVTKKNFASTPSLTLQWKNTSNDPATWDGDKPTDVTLGTDGTISTSENTPAGSYVFRITNGENEFLDPPTNETPNPAFVSSGEITLTVDKLSYTDYTTTATGNLKAKQGSTVDIELPPKPNNTSYGTPVVATELSSNVSAEIQDTNKLRLTVGTEIPANTNPFIVTVPVTTDANHNSYDIVVTVTPVYKTVVTITAEPDDFTYGETGKTGYKDASVTNHNELVSSLVKTYYLSDGETKTTTDNGASAAGEMPTNAGDYKVVLSVPDSNETYEGASEPIAFTIAKADVEAPSLSDAITVNYADETFTPNSGYEVSTTSGDIFATGKLNGQTNITFGTTYYIRKVEDANHNASAQETFVPARPTTPGTPELVSKTDTTVVVTAVTGQEYSLNGTTWQDSNEFTGLTGGTPYTIYTRVKVTGSAFASANSAALSVTTKTTAAAAPSITAANATITENTVTLPYDATYEYQMDSGKWQSGEGKNIFTGLYPATQHTFKVRVKETETAMPSNEATITVYTAAETPANVAATGTVSYSEETFTLTDGYEISTKNGTGSGETFEDGKLIPDVNRKVNLEPGKTYYIRKAASGSVPASEAIELVIPERPAAPAETAFTKTAETVANKKDGSFGGITEAMEYSINGGEWISGPATLTGLSNETVKVRYKATAEVFKSEEYSYPFTLSTAKLTVTMGESSAQVAYDSLVSKPADPEQSGYTFGGWYKDEELTQAWNFGTDTVKGNMTLYPKWIRNNMQKAAISGNVTEGGVGVAGATVELYLGTVKVAATVTKDSPAGNYSFDNVENGVYNIVVTTADGKTKTELVTVDTANTFTKNVELPNKAVNSVVEVEDTQISDAKSDVSKTVVGGLDEIAKNTTVSGSDKITIKLTVEPKADTNTQEQQAIKNEAGNGKKVEFLDVSLLSQVNAEEPTDIGDSNTQLLTIVIPFDFNNVDVSSVMILRKHGTGNAEKLAKNPASGQEGFTVDQQAGTITIYAMKFSDYALAYAEKSSGGGSSSYAIDLPTNVKNGKVDASPKSASAGQTVTLTVTPDKGFTLETLTVLDKNGKEVEVKNLGNNKFSFKMPSGKVSISATFMEDNSMLNFFVDVKAASYYYDAVLWAAENDITKGTDAVHFSPNAPVTRAQVVTFLWRAAGKPVVNYAMSFADVSGDAYYAEAVRWAVAEGITKGTSDTTFSPDKVCTRGQIVTFLARFAGVEDDASGYSHGFTDVKATDYYNNAVAWAKDNKVTEGTSATTFSPNTDCTRAQVVTFLYRYMSK